MLTLNHLTGFGAFSSGGAAPSVPSATVLNAADKGANITLSGGGLIYSDSVTGSAHGVRATQSRSAGKWYWEVRVDSLTGSGAVVVGAATAAAPLTTWIGASAAAWVYLNANGAYYSGSASGGPMIPFAVGDVISVHLDMDAGKLWFAKNGAQQAGGDPGGGSFPAYSGLSGGVFPVIARGDGGTGSAAATFRFSAADWTYAPAAGFAQLP